MHAPKRSASLAERTLGRHQTSSIGWQTAVEKFLDARRAAKIKGRTVDQYRGTLRRNFAFGNAKISEITKRDISAKLEKLNRLASQKAHALVLIKMVFRWALHEGYVEIDPAASFKRPKQNKRTRVLSDAELKAIWNACNEEANELPRHFRTIVKLLILAGQRRSETAALRGSWIVADKITLPAEITKNARVHSFPLGPIAADLLATAEPNAYGRLFPARGQPDRPFNGWSKSKTILDRLSGVSGWTLHDLRRTYRTIHARIGTPPHVAERLINHVDGVASEVEQIYDLHNYMPEMAKAARVYEEALTAILSAGATNRLAA